MEIKMQKEYQIILDNILDGNQYVNFILESSEHEYHSMCSVSKRALYHIFGPAGAMINVLDIDPQAFITRAKELCMVFPYSPIFLFSELCGEKFYIDDANLPPNLCFQSNVILDFKSMTVTKNRFSIVDKDKEIDPDFLDVIYSNISGHKDMNEIFEKPLLRSMV